MEDEYIYKRKNFIPTHGTVTVLFLLLLEEAQPFQFYLFFSNASRVFHFEKCGIWETLCAAKNKGRKTTKLKRLYFGFILRISFNYRMMGIAPGKKFVSGEKNLDGCIIKRRTKLCRGRCKYRKKLSSGFTQKQMKDFRTLILRFLKKKL